MAAIRSRDPSVDTQIGRRVAELRKWHGVASQTLGKQIGVSGEQVRRYESGSDRISAAALYRIACVFQVPFGYFIEGLPDPERRNAQPIDHVTPPAEPTATSKPKTTPLVTISPI